MAFKAVLLIHKSISFFSHVLDNTMQLDMTMISGFLSAINSFSTTISGSSIDAMTFGSSSLVMRNYPLTDVPVPDESSNLTIAALSDKSDTPAKVGERIDEIKELFFQMYTPKDVLDWDGNVCAFLPFKNQLLKLLKGEKVERQTGLALNAPVVHDVMQEPSTVEEYLAMSVSDASGHLVTQISPDIEWKDLERFYATAMRDALQSSSETFDIIIPRLEKRQVVFVHVMKIKDSRASTRFNTNGPIFFTGLYLLGDQHQVYLTRIIPKIKQMFSDCVRSILEENSNAGIEQQWKDAVTIKCKNIAPMKALIESLKAGAEITGQGEKFEFVELKNHEQLIFGLVAGSPIIIYGGHPDWVKRNVNQMLMFTPHRPMQIIEEQHANEDIMGSNIIVFNPKNEKRFKNAVIVDLNKNQVKGGDRNKFCDRLWKEVRSLSDPILAASKIKRNITWLVSKATLLRNLSWGGDIDQSDIAAIRMDMESDTEKLVTMLASGQNTVLQNLIDFMSDHVPQQQLVIDKNFVVFGPKKILVNAHLPPEQQREYLNRLIKFGNTILGPKVMNAALGSNA
ncbi:MAG: hypothetical protein Q6373_001160 [Candidatus Sigynarchaeota archaeon]